MTTTPFSTPFSRGDVFFVNVRFSDGSAVKRRPAIVVSVDQFHAERADALIVPLTTNMASRRFGDFLLKDWEVAGLPRASLAKGIIETIERSTFGRRLGRLTDVDLAGVERSLIDVLGLEDGLPISNA